jgi:membrane-associated phospholipid phosphatase
MHVINMAAAALILLLSAMAATALWVARRAGRQGAGTAPIRRKLTTHPKVLWHWRIRNTAQTLAGPASGVLAVGAIVLCGLAALVGYVFDSVLEGDGITTVDNPAVAWLAEHRHPVLTTMMRVVSTVGSPVAAAAIATIVCALVAWRTRRWLPVVVAALGMAGYALTVTAVKLVVHRQRPPLPYSVIAAHGYSFPSGHAKGIAMSTLISAWALDHWIFRSAGARTATWMAANRGHRRRRLFPASTSACTTRAT